MLRKLKEQELKNYFAQQDDLEFVLIFGSAASGRDSPISDIDVAVYFMVWNFKNKFQPLKIAQKLSRSDFLAPLCFLLREMQSISGTKSWYGISKTNSNH